MANTRQFEYNAVVIATRFVHEDLMVFRTRIDEGFPHYQAGQYTTLGLFTTAPRFDGVQKTSDSLPRLIRRAYSISHPLIDESGKLMPPRSCDFLEFYVSLVRNRDDNPPRLTPRLFAMKEGDRLYVGLKPVGNYTLRGIKPDENVIFAATGTGEAPHNAMLAELLSSNHRGNIASIVSVRYRNDLAYLNAHRQLEKQFNNYRYFPLTTREPENIDPAHPQFVGKRYIQDLFASGALQEQLGWTPDPSNTHVFLCGNPAMIGAPQRRAQEVRIANPDGMIETLVQLGFLSDRPHHPGNIHFETYW